VCPYHGDCWEGLASGRALKARWGEREEHLGQRTEVWQLEARYIALGLVSVTCILSPQRIVLGGGVMKQVGLLGLVHREVGVLLSGYQVGPDPADIAAYVTTPQLGDRSGVVGAIALAEALVAPQSAVSDRGSAGAENLA
jgi:fructokinase